MKPNATSDESTGDFVDAVFALARVDDFEPGREVKWSVSDAKFVAASEVESHRRAERHAASRDVENHHLERFGVMGFIDDFSRGGQWLAQAAPAVVGIRLSFS